MKHKVKQLKNNIIFKNNFLFCLLAFISFLFVFPSGTINGNTRMEKIANYSTQVVAKHTKDKRYCCITVGATEDSGPILDFDKEFHNLYGVFRQTNITSASSINPDKEHDVRIKYNGDDESDNLSFLYLGPVGTKEYKGHYKHYNYPTEFMFEDERMYDVSRYIAYISQTHADNLLESKGAKRQSDGTFSEETYKSLLKQLIPIVIDGQSFDFAVQNIYYEFNYYYEGLHDVMGDFVMVSYYLPLDLRKEQKNMYFLTKYAYENKYFMNYINNGYFNKKYDVQINSYNIIGDIDNDYLLSFYYSESSDNLVSYVLISLSGIVLLLDFLYLHLFFNHFKKRSLHPNPLFFIIPFLPYLLFFTISRITNDISLFSEFATKNNLFMLIGYFLLLLLVFLINRRQQCRIKRLKEEDESYDVSI